MCIKSVTRPNDDELLNCTEKLDLNYDYNDNCFYHEEEINLGYNVSDLSILHLNIRGLVSKQNELKQLISKCSHGRQLDICILNETWLNDGNVYLVNIPGYTLIHKNRTHKKGGGVAILVSDYLKFRRRSDLEQPLNSTENCIIEVDSGKTKQ